MAAPSWTNDQSSAPTGAPLPTGTPAPPPTAGPSFLNDVVAGNQPSAAPPTGIVNSIKGAEEALERGLSGGLSDKFNDWLSRKAPMLSTGNVDEINARKTQNPLTNKTLEKMGSFAVTPVSTTLDSLGVPDGPKIFPQNDYLNPTYGGAAKGIGDVMATAPELPLKALSKMRPMLESLSGLVGPQAEAWIKNPDLVNQLKDALESQKLGPVQDMAGGTLENTIDQLKNRGTTRADVAAKMLDGRSVPYPTEDLQILADKGSPTAKKLLQQAQDELTQKAAQTGTTAPILKNAVPSITATGSDIYGLTQDAGKTYQESGGIHPLTGQQVAKDPNLGRIFNQSRDAMYGLDVGPTVEALRNRTANEIGIQQALSPKIASDTPLTVLNTSSPDQLARLDKLATAGMPELQDTSNAWQAAKNLSNIDFGKGAAGISMPLHGVSPKLSMISSGLNSLTAGAPQRAALAALPYADLGKTSPWFSLQNALENPANAVRVIDNSAKEKNP